MRCTARALGLSFVPGIVAGLLALGTAWAQPGTVLSHQKTSDTQGSFTAPLDNLDEFGGAAVSLGDLDGAGPSVAALAVGAALDDDGGGDRGAVYVLFLDGTGNVLSYQKISSTAGNFSAPLLNLDEFGTSVAYLGDLDGAGPSVAALAVGAPGDDDGGSGRGAVYVLFLASTGNVLSYQKISSTQGGFAGALDNLDEFGGAVAGLGDLDGAGPSVAALPVGAVGDDDGGQDRGAVYVLFLASTGNVLSFQKISSTQGGFAGTLDNLDDFGSTVAGLGDLDGAGPSVSALATGAVFDDDGGTDRGAVYVLFLSSTGNVLSFQKISSTQGGFAGTLDNIDEFGGSLDNLGDLDGSGAGVTTLAVGATEDDDGGGDRGAVYVLFLASTGNVASYHKISSTQGNFTGALDDFDAFGASTGFLGDLDGPGPSMAALAVGATGDDDGGSARGAVYVLFLAGDPTTDVPGVLVGVPGNVLGLAKPNPFHPSTTIPFRLNEAADVQIDIRDVSGRIVRRLVRAFNGPGEHRAEWDGRDDSGRPLAAGAYFYRMTVNGRVATTTGRAVLLR